ncbi:MAG: PHB depolymerase family esterase [Anaerolineales bacterium]|jgi:polyhydroxybutyrate depolymerase
MMKTLFPGAAVFATAMLVLSGCAQGPSLTAIASPTTAATISPGDSERALTVDGMERSYFLHVPSDLAADQPVPLVLIFHGFSGTGESMAITTGFDDLADTYGFLVVYPNGMGPVGATSWNAGGCCGYAESNNLDEAAFVRKIISDLQTGARIDPKRIYATGFSNGAFLTYRLGCEMSDVLAAVAPVAGVLLNNPCQPQHPVSVLHIHGMTDLSVPYAGSTTPAASGVFESVQQSIATWVHLDGCPSAPDLEQNGLTTHATYAPCKSGTTVELYTLQGIGHTWPPNAILPASQIIWNFFVAHPKA